MCPRDLLAALRDRRRAFRGENTALPPPGAFLSIEEYRSEHLEDPRHPGAGRADRGCLFRADVRRTRRARARLAGRRAERRADAGGVPRAERRDKGAARLLREKLDEIKRAKGQEAIAAEWAEKAAACWRSRAEHRRRHGLAARRRQGGRPLSREPLAGVKTQLAERIRASRTCRTGVQVQREAAVLLAQRIEVLSTKSWKDAEGRRPRPCAPTVPQWQVLAQSLWTTPTGRASTQRFPPLLEASRSQLQVVGTPSRPRCPGQRRGH
jgi:hypothetical protein